MTEDRKVSFGAGHRFRAAEQTLIGHLDVVGRRAIEGALTAMLDASAGRGDKAVSSSDALDGTKRLRRARRGEAVDLAGVEDVGRAGNAALAVIIGIVGIRARCRTPCRR